jgi:hypothetical protein
LSRKVCENFQFFENRKFIIKLDRFEILYKRGKFPETFQKKFLISKQSLAFFQKLHRFKAAFVSSYILKKQVKI